ncbi:MULTISPECIES: gas vesicle protein GvpG [Mycolicibacterium]|uniref:gas vesicle protein GvpG n=1 Tax=Mycolicibacterium monacense TaxID=85693 RepID=UPI0007E9FF8F|nr:gas vesicle protein GvpG [Mycolicibacterium monacense]OBB76400.1 gas vesicle protein G [Mycolicibacterium monacense]OBF48528.1 gas vesicle protein G [Mycolicibacterium monacense]
MGLFSAILLAPLLPVRGVISLAEVIQRQVEQEMNDPARTRAQLEALAEARDSGEISAEEEKAAQREILAERMEPQTPGATPPESG